MSSRPGFERPVVATVLVCTLVGLVFGIAAVSWMLPSYLPDPLATRLLDANSRLLKVVPDRVFNVVIQVLYGVSITTFFAACCVALVAGSRALRAGGLRLPALALTAWGGLLSILLCGGPLAFHEIQMTRMEESARDAKASMESIRERLERGLVPPARRQMAWRLYAEGIYWHEGTAIQYPDEHGEMVTFEPTEADVNSRRTFVQLKDSFRPPYIWTFSALALVSLIVALGVFTPLGNVPPRPGLP